MVTKTIPETTVYNHAIRGMRVSFMPGHRMQTVVATKFTAVAMLLMPLNKTANVQ
jgi:hypothetical protein